jgi:hypothetical protein
MQLIASLAWACHYNYIIIDIIKLLPWMLMIRSKNNKKKAVFDFRLVKNYFTMSNHLLLFRPS